MPADHLATETRVAPRVYSSPTCSPGYVQRLMTSVLVELTQRRVSKVAAIWGQSAFTSVPLARRTDYRPLNDPRPIAREQLRGHTVELKEHLHVLTACHLGVYRDKKDQFRDS